MRTMVVAVVLLLAARAAHADSDSYCSYGKVPVDGTASACCYPGETYHPGGTAEAPAHTCWGEPVCPENYQFLAWSDPHSGSMLNTCELTPGAPNPYASGYTDPVSDPYATSSAPSAPSESSRINGHLPYLTPGIVGILAFGDYTQEETDAGNYGMRLGGGVGVEVELHLDLKKVLVTIDGTAALGSHLLTGRANLVLGAGLGKRTSSAVTEVVGSSTSGNTQTTTYAVHNDLRVPLYYGLYLGASTMVNDVNTTVTAEAGFALVGAQLQLIAAPMIEVGSGAFGFRWGFTYAMPLSSRLFYGRLGGDHIGGDQPYGTAMTLSFGITSSMGVSI